MLHRRIRNVDDITNHINWTTNMPNDGQQHPEIQLCRFGIIRWLKGKGHPKLLEGSFVDSTKFKREADDPLLRANLFHMAVSDSDLLDLKPKFEVHRFVFIHLRWLTYFPDINRDPSSCPQ
jgi:hypothetical protein